MDLTPIRGRLEAISALAQQLDTILSSLPPGSLTPLGSARALVASDEIARELEQLADDLGRGVDPCPVVVMDDNELLPAGMAVVRDPHDG